MYSTSKNENAYKNWAPCENPIALYPFERFGSSSITLHAYWIFSFISAKNPFKTSFIISYYIYIYIYYRIYICLLIKKILIQTNLVGCRTKLEREHVNVRYGFKYDSPQILKRSVAAFVAHAVPNDDRRIWLVFYVLD